LIDFYAFRPYFMVFFGPEKIPPEAGRHAQESPGVMTVPLMILAFGSLTVGAYFEWTHGFAHFLAATPFLPSPQATSTTVVKSSHIGLMSTGITAFGILLAAVLYLGNPKNVQKLTKLMNVFGLYTVSHRAFFFDVIYEWLIVRPMLGFARLAAWFDAHVIDPTVDAVGHATSLFGTPLRPLQNGFVQFYALAMMLGLLLLILGARN
jgi:NADH-quinone oxidoreductase subunit L